MTGAGQLAAFLDLVAVVPGPFDLAVEYGEVQSETYDKDDRSDLLVSNIYRDKSTKSLEAWESELRELLDD